MGKIFRNHPFFLIWLWFIFLALLFTRPLIQHCGHAVAGEIGDNIYFIWMIGWVEKALFTLHSNPLNVWYLNYPEGWNMAHTEMAPAQLALAQPFSLAGGETLAYNVVMLLSFVLAGVIMCGWVRNLSGSLPAGLVSGTIYACLPYWGAHFLIGHLNLCGTQWLPLFFWGWFDLFKPVKGKFQKKPALLAALGLGLTALTSQYYFFMLVIVAGIQALFLLLTSQREKLRDLQFWKSCGLFLLISLPLLVAAELPFLNLAGSGGMPDRDWGSVRMYSAGLTDYLLPGTTHFAFGQWVGEHFNRDIWPEATLYVGVVSLILFLIGLSRRRGDSPQIWPLIVSGVLAALILSMGTDLHWNGAPLEWTLPAFLREKLGRETLPILLPGYFFFKYFPFYGKLRAMMRFGIFALLLVSCGAGLGVKKLTDRGSSLRKAGITTLLLLLVVLDFLPRAYTHFEEILARPVDTWLAQQKGNGSVMRYPFYLNDDQAGTYYTLYNEKPFIGGFFNAFPTAQYQEIRDVMRGFPSEESLRLAQKLKVQYYLIETDELQRAIDSNEVPWKNLAELQSAAESLDLQLVGTFENVLLYELNTEDCDCGWLKDSRF